MHNTYKWSYWVAIFTMVIGCAISGIAGLAHAEGFNSYLNPPTLGYISGINGGYGYPSISLGVLRAGTYDGLIYQGVLAGSCIHETQIVTNGITHEVTVQYSTDNELTWNNPVQCTSYSPNVWIRFTFDTPVTFTGLDNVLFNNEWGDMSRGAILNHADSPKQQFGSDGVTPIQEGVDTDDFAVVLQAVATSPYGDPLQVQFEMRSIAESFTGEPTATSSFVAWGSTVTVTVPVAENTEYHWRVRTINERGEASDWEEFGTPGNSDFKARMRYWIPIGNAHAIGQINTNTIQSGAIFLQSIIGDGGNLNSFQLKGDFSNTDIVNQYLNNGVSIRILDPANPGTAFYISKWTGVFDFSNPTVLKWTRTDGQDAILKNGHAYKIGINFNGYIGTLSGTTGNEYTYGSLSWEPTWYHPYGGTCDSEWASYYGTNSCRYNEATTDLTFLINGPEGYMIGQDSIPLQYWAAINSSSTLNMRDSAGLQGTTIKTLPSGWVVKVLQTADASSTPIDIDGYRWYQIQDATDGSIGWMSAGPVQNSQLTTEYLSYDSAKQADFEYVASHQFATMADRWHNVTATIQHYYDNTDTNSALQSSNDSPSRLSTLKENNFPKFLVEAIAKQESSAINFDNEWVVGDLGHGVMQVTNSGVLGSASKIKIPSCEYPNNRYDCYSAIVSAPVYNDDGSLLHNWDKRNYTRYKYYTNSSQSVDANIKDGMSRIVSAFKMAKNAVGHSDENYTISTPEMRNISTVYRYNQGSPYKTQAAYMVYERVKTLPEIRAELISHGALSTWVTEHITSGWQGEILARCPSSESFSFCLSAANKEPQLIISASYLSQVASKLDASQQDIASKMKYVNDNSSITWLRSPGELRIIDAAGNVTGMTNGTSSEDIPNSVYDSGSKMATLFFPTADTKYEVVGTETGKYGFVSTDFATGQTVSLRDIPTEKSAIHTIAIDWNAIAQGEKGVTMQIDENADGIPESTVKIGPTLDDTQAPTTTLTISGTQGANGWYVSTTTVALIAADGPNGIGVAKTTYSLDGGDWQTYATSSPIGITADGTHVLRYFSADYLGNQEATTSIQVNIDTTVPAISHSIIAPQYQLNASPVQFVFSAASTTSGLSAISATLDGVASVSPSSLTFDQVGNHVITILVQSVAGATASTSVNYNVGYHFGGFSNPVKADGSGVYKLGRTLPIKFQLTDANSSLVSTAVAHLVVAKVTNGIAGTDPVDLAVSANDTGSLFRYDDGQYIYNFDTGQLAIGTWQLKAVLDDGNSYSVLISLR